jgi:hypothetical protein
VLRLVDISHYLTNSGVPPTCPQLLITTPGFNKAVSIAGVQPGFIYNLTACDLGLQTTRCGEDYYDLPDGIYILKYSVSPNEYVYVEYNHLRITKALNIINEILCDLDLGACAPPQQVEARLRELNLIRMYLLAAVASVEDCREPKRGMELYNFALRLLNKMDCRTGCRR